MNPFAEANMVEAEKRRFEIPTGERHLLATHFRMLEEFSQRLAELFHPFESCLVHRLPLSRENAEQLQRVYSHLRSRISKAVWDLGLSRINQDSQQELECLVAEMEEILQGLLSVASREGIPGGLEAYLTQLVLELRRIANEIARVAGTKTEKTSVIG